VVCLPEFVSHKLGNARIWADSRLLASVGSDLLANPDLLFARIDCQVIKDQLKIKVGCLILEIDGIPTGVYLKRYNAFSPRYRIASLILSSGAVKSLRGAEVLSRVGVSTGRPLAAIESRSRGMVESSFFVTEEIPLGKPADEYWRKDLLPMKGVERFRHRRQFLKNLARLFNRLHQNRIYHNDLKDANIFVTVSARGDEHFSLLDLEGVRRCWYLSRRRRVKNLVQLDRTLGKCLARTAKLYFLKTYLGETFASKRNKRRWVTQVLRATKRANVRSEAKQASNNN